MNQTDLFRCFLEEDRVLMEEMTEVASVTYVWVTADHILPIKIKDLALIFDQCF